MLMLLLVEARRKSLTLPQLLLLLLLLLEIHCVESLLHLCLVPSHLLLRFNLLNLLVVHVLSTLSVTLS